MLVVMSVLERKVVPIRLSVLTGFPCPCLVRFGLFTIRLAISRSLYAGDPQKKSIASSFDGVRFVNQAPTEHVKFSEVLRWILSREGGSWRWIQSPPGPPPPERVTDGRMRVTFVNHATLLLQQDGINVLTDPIWSERASPLSWVGPRRFRPPGLRFEDLPPIDVVVISHSHYDHMDLATLQRLHAAHRPHFFVGRGNKALLESAGIDRVEEFDWWDEREVAPGVTVIGTPAQHFSGRSPFDRDKTLWMGWAIRGSSGVAYFAGDTGWGPHFLQVRERLGPPRLALLPIGAYLPQFFMSRIHISPEEAVYAHQALDAGVSVGMHFGTFDLADDGQFDPPTKLRAALERASVEKESFWILEFGEGRDVPPRQTALGEIPAP